MERLYEAVLEHSGMEPDQLLDVLRGGADAGFPGYTYTSECAEFFLKHSEEIWDLLFETARDMGMQPLELAASFSRSDMAETFDGFACLMGWFCLESTAAAYERGEVGHDSEDEDTELGDDDQGEEPEDEE